MGGHNRTSVSSRADKDVDNKLEQYMLINKQISKTITLQRVEIAKLKHSLRNSTSEIINLQMECHKWKKKFLTIRTFYIEHIHSITSELQTNADKINSISDREMDENDDNEISHRRVCSTAASSGAASTRNDNDSRRNSKSFESTKNPSVRSSANYADMDTIDEENEVESSLEISAERIEDGGRVTDDSDVDKEGDTTEGSGDSGERSEDSNVDGGEKEGDTTEGSGDSGERSEDSNVDGGEKEGDTTEGSGDSGERSEDSNEVSNENEDEGESEQGEEESEASDGESEASGGESEASDGESESDGEANSVVEDEEQVDENDSEVGNEDGDISTSISDAENKSGGVDKISLFTTKTDSTIKDEDSDKENGTTSPIDPSKSAQSISENSQSVISVDGQSLNKSTPQKSLNKLPALKRTMKARPVNGSANDSIQKLSFGTTKVNGLISSTPYRNNNVSNAAEAAILSPAQSTRSSMKAQLSISSGSQLSASSLSSRPKRKAAPLILSEPKLNTKLRRPR